VNLFVARKADVTNKTYLGLADLFHDPAVQKAFLKDYPAAVASDTSAADLQAELTQVEKDARAATK
jgi:D-methionine transport system substrate-binding protein